MRALYIKITLGVITLLLCLYAAFLVGTLSYTLSLKSSAPASRLLYEVQSRKRAPLDDLTPHGLEVLKCLARGCSNTEIASDPVISEPTVKTHVSNILSKLHPADRTQAAIYALQQHVVALQDALERE